MKHLLVIDPLEKLVIKKDSTLLFALVLKEQGINVQLLFQKDLAFCNQIQSPLKVYDFDGSYDEKTCYLNEFTLGNEASVIPDTRTVFHMRLDPPFDISYLRVLWFLEFYESRGSRVINRPVSLAINNEKFVAYKHQQSIPTYVGSSYESAKNFVETLGEDCTDLILKPLDLYQGMGVNKYSKMEFLKESFRPIFQKYMEDYNGHAILQPFQKEVTSGEIRALYFNGVELGHIKKIPPRDSFLANIAQGATFEAYQLNSLQKKLCDEIAQDLKKQGVLWIAYDLLGNKVSEVNITCPGLLVEVSKANGVNLAQKIVQELTEGCL